MRSPGVSVPHKTLLPQHPILFRSPRAQLRKETNSPRTRPLDLSVPHVVSVGHKGEPSHDYWRCDTRGRGSGRPTDRTCCRNTLTSYPVLNGTYRSCRSRGRTFHTKQDEVVRTPTVSGRESWEEELGPVTGIPGRTEKVPLHYLSIKTSRPTPRTVRREVLSFRRTSSF